MVVFPAQAGMNRPTKSRLRTTLGVPRTGGDEPLNGADVFGIVMCSPYSWKAILPPAREITLKV